MPQTLRPDLFAVNPNPVLSTHKVGLGQHKVIIADHFYRYPDDILQTTLELSYTDRFEIVGNFPGVRADPTLKGSLRGTPSGECETKTRTPAPPARYSPAYHYQPRE